jgi:hypothetical protein
MWNRIEMHSFSLLFMRAIAANAQMRFVLNSAHFVQAIKK